ncbi:hypothetical protein ACFLZV_01300 [Candidatus Margulisiibacteriota bacterium]
MLKEIAYIDPASLGKTIAVITLSLTALFLAPLEFLLLKQMIVKNYFHWQFVSPLLFLVVNPVVGYLLGIIIAFFYNFFAKRIGGLEIQIEN